MNKQILIIGTKGFVSRNLISFFNSQSFDVYSTSNKLIKKNVYYFDLKDNDEINFKDLPKIDYLINCAYYKTNNYKAELKINLEGAKRIFDFAKKNQIKIVHISSLSANSKAKSNYGKVKFQIEKIAKKYQSIIIRPGLIYSKEDPGGIYESLEKIIKLFPIVLIPSGPTNKQHLCDMNILNESILNIINNENQISQLHIVSQQQAVSIQYILKSLAKKNSKKIILINVNYKIILYLLKFIEFIGINLKIKSDNLVSLMDYNSN